MDQNKNKRRRRTKDGKRDDGLRITSLNKRGCSEPTPEKGVNIVESYFVSNLSEIIDQH